jgi:hypothetical protein
MGNGLNKVNNINRSLRLNLRRKQKGLPPRSMRAKRVTYVDGKRYVGGKLAEEETQDNYGENPTAAWNGPTLKGGESEEE